MKKISQKICYLLTYLLSDKFIHAAVDEFDLYHLKLITFMKISVLRALLSKRLISATFILALVFACTTQHNPEPQSVKVESNVSASVVPIDDAIKIAESFSGFEDANKDSKKNLREKGDKPKKIKETKILKSKEGIPHIYISNYEDGGFIIMSADDRFIPVLAYVEKGKNYSEENRKQNYGFDNWLTWVSESIMNIQDGKLKPLEGVKELWEKQISGADFTSKKGRAACYDWLTVVPPLLNTSYQQGHPYNNALGLNNFCPPFPWNPTGNPLVGCVATAMSQLMHYHNHPNYNWGDMNSIANANRDTGLSVGMSYGCGESTADASNIPGALSSFGFYGHSWHFMPNGIYPLENDLQSNRPVILFANNASGGSAHVWIADGIWVYHQACPQAEIYHLHMNWGWGGENDGWYFSNFWTNNRGNFTINQFALINTNRSW